MHATHRDLCSLAVKWLRRPDSQSGPGCNTALSECTGSYSGEIADAIGWRSIGDEQFSVLVEAKASRSDFLSDARKPHRAGEAIGMGRFRYYLAPAGIIGVDELPPRWGLIELVGRGLKVRAGHVLVPRTKEAGWRKDCSDWAHASDERRETALLVRMLSRVGDPDEYQQRLKAKNRALAESQRIIDSKNAELRRALDQYWDVRRKLDEIEGGVHLAAIPRSKSTA